MQLTATFKPSATTAVRHTRSRSRTLAVIAQQQPEAATRRSAIAGLAALPALLAAAPALAAFGKDVNKAMQDKEKRKQKLKESADKMRTTQKTDAAFEDSKYGLPEDSTTPNMRGLANDRSRTED